MSKIEEVPPKEDEEYPESIEVATKVNGEWFQGYYNHAERNWWIDFGGITVGHRLIDNNELDEWRLKE